MPPCASRSSGPDRSAQRPGPPAASENPDSRSEETQARDRRGGAAGPSPGTTWRINGGIRDVRRARQLAGRCVGDQPEAIHDAAVLLVDECVANAVRYGGGRFELTIHRRAGWLRVEVVDHSAIAPALLATAPESASGRGLAIIEMLASQWGSDPIEDGKVVWFELALA